MANPASSWIPHVEAFVDFSRSPDQHAASLEALSLLARKDKLTLFGLVKEMEMYLTTTDHIVRSRGILLLGEILSRISSKPLDSNTITTLTDFFISRLSDWQALRGALVGCLALLRRKGSVGTVVISDVKKLVGSFLTNVQVQSLATTDRKLCFEVLNFILDHFPEAVKTLGDELLYGICEAIDEEKDPKCLKLSFRLVETVMKSFPDPSGLAAQFASEVFEILSKYFPVYFTHGGGDDLGVTRDELSRALMNAFCSTPYFEPFAVPLLVDKLSSSLPLAKLDSLKYLNNCICCYGADRMVKHASAIWFSLKEVIFSLSPDQLSLTSGSPKDTDMDKDQIVTEALHCLKTFIMYSASSDKDLFINLILLDKDIVNKVHSVMSEESSIGSLLQSQGQLNALGSVISILAESSTCFCTRVVQAHFTSLMDILRASAGYESHHSNIYNGSFSGPINYGALYLSVKILSSCRDVAVASKEDYSPDASTNETWWHILEKNVGPLIHLLGSLLTMNCQSMQREVRQEHISCAVKGLQLLATFPEQGSPIAENAYQDILLMLTSVVTSKYEDTYMWKLSLKTLAHIGSYVVEFHASRKGAIYRRIVVDKIICFVQLNDTVMPLNLRLDSSFEVGSAGLDYMSRVARELEEAIITNISEVNGRTECADHVIHLLEFYSSRVLPWLCTSGSINEPAVQFAIRLWDKIGDVTTLNRIRSQGLLSSLTKGMKLLVGACAKEQQLIIVQKAYDILSAMLSLPVKSMAHSLLDVDKLVASDSFQDSALVCLFSSVVVGLHPQTPIPDISIVLNIFTAFLLKGQVEAAHALASIINKCPANINSPESLNEHKLNETLDVILEKCFSTVLTSYYLKTSFYSGDSLEYASCSENYPRSITLNIGIWSGLAWIGKGLLMRGEEKVKDITMFLLGCLLSNDKNLSSIPSHQDEYDSSAAWDASSLLATSAADAFHVMMSDSEECLNKNFHARIKPLYKQRFFSVMMPIFLTEIKAPITMRTKVVLYRAFGHIISNAPIPAVITEAHQILLVLVDILAKLSVDDENKDLVYSLLLVLSGILMDEKGKQCIVENIHIVIGILTQLVSYPPMMLVRETAIQCLVAMSNFPHPKIYPVRAKVLQAVIRALDDKKRAVRQEAVRCRQTWASIV